MTSLFSAKQSRSRTTCNGGLGGFVQLEELAEVYRTRTPTPVEGKRASMNPFDRIRKRKSAPPPIAIPLIPEGGSDVDSAAVTTGSVLSGGRETPPVPPSLRSVTPVPVHKPNTTNNEISEDNLIRTPLASPKTPNYDVDLFLDVKITSRSSSIFQSASATPSKTNSLVRALPKGSDLPLAPLDQVYELPGSLLLPNQGFDFPNLVPDHLSVIASSRSSQSSRSSSEDRSSTRTKSPPTSSVNSSPVQEKSDMLGKVFGNKEEKRRASLPEVTSLASLSIDELMRVLPLCDSSRVHNEWGPAMRRQLDHFKGDLQRSAESKEQQIAKIQLESFTEPLESIRTSAQSIADTYDRTMLEVVPAHNVAVEKVRTELRGALEELESTSLLVEDREQSIQDLESLLSTHRASIRTLVSFVHKFNSLAFANPTKDLATLTQEAQRIISYNQGILDQTDGSPDDSTAQSNNTSFVSIRESEYLAKERQLRHAHKKIEKWKALSAEQKHVIDFNSAKLDSYADLIREKNEKIQVSDKEIALFKLDVKGYKRDAREHIKLEEAMEVLAQRHLELEAKHSIDASSHQTTMAEKDGEIEELKRQIAELKQSDTASSFVPSYTSTSVAELTPSDAKSSCSSNSARSFSVVASGGLSATGSRTLRRNQFQGSDYAREHLTIDTSVARPPIDRAATTGLRSRGHLPGSRSMQNISRSFTSTSVLNDQNQRDPLKGLSNSNRQTAPSGLPLPNVGATSTRTELAAAMAEGKLSPKLNTKLGLMKETGKRKKLKPDDQTDLALNIKKHKPRSTDSLNDLNGMIAAAGGSGALNITPPSKAERDREKLAPLTSISAKELSSIPARIDSLGHCNSAPPASKLDISSSLEERFGPKIMKDSEANNVIFGEAAPIPLTPKTPRVTLLSLDKKLPRLPNPPDKLNTFSADGSAMTAEAEKILQSSAKALEDIPTPILKPPQKLRKSKTRSTTARLSQDPIKQPRRSSTIDVPRSELHNRYPSQGVLPSPVKSPRHDRYPSKGILSQEDQAKDDAVSFGRSRKPSLRRMTTTISSSAGINREQDVARTGRWGSNDNAYSVPASTPTKSTPSLIFTPDTPRRNALLQEHPPPSAPASPQPQSIPEAPEAETEYIVAGNESEDTEFVQQPSTPGGMSTCSGFSVMGRRNNELLKKMDGEEWPFILDEEESSQAEEVKGHARLLSRVTEVGEHDTY
ncbi:MAG: hypothetical protein Q9227_005691 [Pyrenula ochraceoflavens]